MIEEYVCNSTEDDLIYGIEDSHIETVAERRSSRKIRNMCRLFRKHVTYTERCVCTNIDHDVSDDIIDISNTMSVKKLKS